MKTTTTLHLSKEKFKFSSGHFLIFDETRAERLHGHNYSVQVKVEGAKSSQNKGYLIDFSILKKIITEQLDQWDEHVLIPEKHPDMEISRTAKNLEIHFRDRFYSLPVSEVILLPVMNTSVEELSRLLAEKFLEKMQSLGVSSVWVLVEETPGQGASTQVEN